MEIDKTTLDDLAIFNRDEEYSIFHRLNFTRTTGGSDQLKILFQQPLPDIRRIRQTQEVLRFIGSFLNRWPEEVSNGTLMVIDRFFDTQHAPVSAEHGGALSLERLTYRLFNSADYGLLRYSLTHVLSFVQGMGRMVELMDPGAAPPQLSVKLEAIARILHKPGLQEMASWDVDRKPNTRMVLHFGYLAKQQHKRDLQELMDLYHYLDAWYSMARAMETYHFGFPEFLDEPQPRFEAEGLFHPLLSKPVSYQVQLNKDTNFLFLTGANMAGKSTFIKAIGIAVYLAHLGMGVPASRMRLSFFDGLLSNIQVQDNIFKGESYFYNEVQRVKKTILKINDTRHWLILIDELFKGTNFQDAKHCSSIVIEGLLAMRDSLFVLSTHLYEIAEGLQTHANIQFKYFETFIEADIPSYSYQLKDGISNDRLGFLILKREHVLELLDQVRHPGSARTDSPAEAASC